ncbi:peptidase MA family metallohydrolase, partial [Singulisphaera rosea]
FAKDGYNVLAYNLVTLRDRLAGFRTLESDGFLVRMDKREADLYGERVLALLRRAKETLCKTYEVTLKEPVIVEIFPQKKEFAVRTFGLPGADGFLGVCFGRLITANSPASQGETPSNWEAVLWHEFCHVVTLTKTHNKMPRWLSEGISVYEESRQDPAWGMPMDPRFRAMLLEDSLTPLSKLSAAFLAPETPHHLQFAYYESALAVGFLVERFGLPSLKGLLDDLAVGTAMNDALPVRTKTSLVQLDREFAEYARKKAQAVAPGATWEEPELPQDADSKALSTWVEAHPRSFWGWKRLAARFVAEENWLRARHALEKLKELFPEYVGPENAYMLQAVVARKLSD